MFQYGIDVFFIQQVSVDGGTDFKRNAGRDKQIQGSLEQRIAIKPSDALEQIGRCFVIQCHIVNQLLAEVSHGAREQSQGIAQVNQAVTLLDQTTQQNAALVEESSAAAASLSDQAQRLQMAVGRFRLA